MLIYFEAACAHVDILIYIYVRIYIYIYIYSHMEIYSLCNLYAHIDCDMHLLIIYHMSRAYIVFLSRDFPSSSSIRPDARF